jgi:glycosyltransferase involved in cell wall biosynthesis
MEEPDVVVVQDLAAPAYIALRMRHLGLALENTLFVVYCHGTRQWITDAARKVRVLPGALAMTVLERASIELADWVVSPSEYLVRWMQRQNWRLPAQTTVIPYLTHAAATEERLVPRRDVGRERLRRIVFFGRLEERKGIAVFAAALNRVDSHLLRGVELEFVGTTTKAWPPSRVLSTLAKQAQAELTGVRFETSLEQQEALARLSRPGTLVVMPSLEDNSPNTVYECLELGIPFLASGTGGTRELIAFEDRDRVLFEPTPEGVASALTQALETAEMPAAARRAFDDDSTLAKWDDVVSSEPPRLNRVLEQSPVDVVVVGRLAGPSSRCVSALERQTYPAVHTLAAEDVSTGVRAGAAPWVVFLDHEDEPDETLVEMLVRGQQASDADVVTCGVQVVSSEGRCTHLFPGEPGGLGILGNGYGTAALVRRRLLSGVDLGALAGATDPEWQLLVRLSLEGARIVSIPQALLTRARPPGGAAGTARDAPLVVQEFEALLPRPLASLARLAAGLAADEQTSRAAQPPGVLERVRRRLTLR